MELNNERNLNTEENKVTSSSGEQEVNMEEIKCDSKKRERSPATDRKLSDRASEYALIQYLTTLAKNKNSIESFDFAFVEYLLENGAVINNCDIIGQSAFHIVAKFWSIDVARFLLDHGANIDAQDCLGRSPLHEATALNYVDMVEFLLQNGANLNIKTVDQEQRPIHFAAKNDSCETLNTLLAYGADINSLDSKKRTPLQVAAEMNRAKIAELLIKEGASAAIYDDDGSSALTLLTEKLPDVALIALNQLHSVDCVNRKEFFSLNNLEGPRLNKDRASAAHTPLEIAVQNRRFSILMHPVVQRLIAVKWDYYGKYSAISDLMLNLVYVLLWTILSLVLSYRSQDIYLPLNPKGWRLAIVIAIIIVTGKEIKKHISDTLFVRRQQKDWIEWRASALEEDLAYCHPRCPEEWRYLSDEVKAVRNQSHLPTEDGWCYLDLLALILVIATIVSHIIFLKHNTISIYKVHSGILFGLLLILWIRIAKYARPFQSTGPIVVIFAHILKDVIKCGFLFAILFIPYVCAFWVTFGPNSPKPVKGYSNIFELFYNMHCMVLGIDFPFDDLLAEDPFMARLLCSTFIIGTAIVVVNLLIALLSDTFTRLYSNALANALMQRAQSILVIERRVSKRKYYKYMRDNCSPQVIPLDHESEKEEDRDNCHNMVQLLREMKQMKKEIQGKSAPVQGEAGKQIDVTAIKSMVSQVMKQNQEMMIKMNKMNAILMEQKEPEGEPFQQIRQNMLYGRRYSVRSAVSVRPDIFECFDLDTVSEDEEDEKMKKKVETKERRGSILTPNIIDKPNNADGRYNLRPSKRARFSCNDGLDNNAFEDSDYDSRPSCSNYERSELRSRRRDSVRNISTLRRSTLRRNSTINFPCPNFPQVFAERVVHLDRKDSTTLSISL